jgi:LysM repeat protein
MNSLRPLITISILAVVGAWLYVKINEGPTRPAHSDAEAFQGQTVEGVPPLSATTAAQTADAGEAPKWPASAANTPPVTVAQPAPTTLQPAPGPVGGPGLPDMPAIPALPNVSAPPQSPPANAANAVPVTLPANIPQARYPDAVDSVGSTPNTISPQSPALGGEPVTAPLTTPSTSEHENSVATNNAMAAVGLTPQPPATSSTPPIDTNASPAMQTALGADRYGVATSGATDRPLTQSAPPVEPTFAGAWPDVQTALDRGDLARAHQLLSKWYNDDSLTPAEAEKVESLLGQLAGSVVYSTEHQLEPAYTVRPGQNLESIAKDYNVPWQLLAKINGVASVDAVQPGQKLKVLRGPFSAVVDLRRNRLTLMLDGRYAGKFPIAVPTTSSVIDGQWQVEQKLVTAPTNVTQTSYAPTPAAVDRAIVLRGEDATTGKPTPTGPTLTIASAVAATGPEGKLPTIRISPQDAEELSDILSVGSRVTIRK